MPGPARSPFSVAWRAVKAGGMPEDKRIGFSSGIIVGDRPSTNPTAVIVAWKPNV
ncbi:hypothetical protein SAMN05444161_4705 [Rhizobiales bacterium GAS191]|nr:hypothetical protein SAMN05444161_4705 [Rhizobiales bacterium GAS191]